MRAGAVVFVAAAAFAWLAARGTVHIGSRPPTEPAIVLRAGAKTAAPVPRHALGVAVRRRVEHVWIGRYTGDGRR